MDISGKIITSAKVREAESIDLSGLAKGMYIYHISSHDQQLLKTGKLAIQ